MELKDTISLMQSADYKERFKAEYHQLVIRYKKLKAMLEDWDQGELKAAHTTFKSRRWLTILLSWRLAPLWRVFPFDVIPHSGLHTIERWRNR